MDQKVMELLAKIYQTQTEMQSEFKDLKSGFKDLKSEFKDLRSEFKDLRSEVKDIRSDQETVALNVAKIMTVVEHDIANKIGAIFTFREIQIEHNQKTDEALERIEAKVEVLQLETSHLRRVK